MMSRRVGVDLEEEQQPREHRLARTFNRVHVKYGLTRCIQSLKSIADAFYDADAANGMKDSLLVISQGGYGWGKRFEGT